MTTITWKNLKTGITSVEICRSRDKLNKILQGLKVDAQSGKHFKEEKVGRTINQVIVKGVSYETEDELALFQRYGILPKRDEYGN